MANNTGFTSADMKDFNQEGEEVITKKTPEKENLNLKTPDIKTEEIKKVDVTPTGSTVKEVTASNIQAGQSLSNAQVDEINRQNQELTNLKTKKEELSQTQEDFLTKQAETDIQTKKDLALKEESLLKTQKEEDLNLITQNLKNQKITNDKNLARARLLVSLTGGTGGSLEATLTGNVEQRADDKIADFQSQYNTVGQKYDTEILNVGKELANGIKSINDELNVNLVQLESQLINDISIIESTKGKNTIEALQSMQALTEKYAQQNIAAIQYADQQKEAELVRAEAKRKQLVAESLAQQKQDAAEAQQTVENKLEELKAKGEAGTSNENDILSWALHLKNGLVKESSLPKDIKLEILSKKEELDPTLTDQEELDLQGIVKGIPIQIRNSEGEQATWKKIAKGIMQNPENANKSTAELQKIFNLEISGIEEELYNKYESYIDNIYSSMASMGDKDVVGENFYSNLGKNLAAMEKAKIDGDYQTYIDTVAKTQIGLESQIIEGTQSITQEFRDKYKNTHQVLEDFSTLGETLYKQEGLANSSVGLFDKNFDAVFNKYGSGEADVFRKKMLREVDTINAKLRGYYSGLNDEELEKLLIDPQVSYTVLLDDVKNASDAIFNDANNTRKQAGLYQLKSTAEIFDPYNINRLKNATGFDNLESSNDLWSFKGYNTSLFTQSQNNTPDLGFGNQLSSDKFTQTANIFGGVSPTSKYFIPGNLND